MPVLTSGMSLRIYLGDMTRARGERLHETIISLARTANLANVTILRGPLGFGESKILRSAKILRLSIDLPIIIQIVDDETKIKSFLPQLEPFAAKCLITLVKIELQIGA